MTLIDERTRKALMRAALEGKPAPEPSRIRREPDSYKHYTAYGKGAQAEALPSWSEYSIETPGRSPHPVADVAVPLLQAVVSGILAGGAAALVAARLTEADPALVGGVAALAVTGVVWSTLLADSRRLLRRIETWTRQDLDGDGAVGDPGKPKQETVRLEIHKDQDDGGGRQTLFSDVPVSEAKLRAWAQGATGGRSLALGSWTGSKGPFSRSEYDALMDAMERARVVAWNNPDSPRSGRRVTKMGEAALKAWLSS